jgi:hypothetical protein
MLNTAVATTTDRATNPRRAGASFVKVNRAARTIVEDMLSMDVPPTMAEDVGPELMAAGAAIGHAGTLALTSVFPGASLAAAAAAGIPPLLLGLAVAGSGALLLGKEIARKC